MPTRSFVTTLLLAFVVSSYSGTGRADDPRETPLVRAVKRARAAAVNIHSEKSAYAADAAFGTGKKGRKINGMGTGIVIDERGYIVTNHHVVNGVDSLTVTLDNGNTAKADVISEDPVRDLAILKITPLTPLTVMPLGTSSDLMLGETVFAVGNAYGYENTVTMGIVSALNRNVEVNDTQSYKNLIQTDAAINPGNSGGPLVNMNGEVIGINVAIRANAQKIGFAIPIDDARKIIADLLKIEYFDGTQHGLVTRDFKTGGERKLVVESAKAGSPAESAGLKFGDVIFKAGQVAVRDGADLERALLGHNAGDEVRLAIKRGGKSEELAIRLAPASNDQVVSGAGSVIVHNENDPLSLRLWDVIGLRVAKVQRSHPGLVNSKYEGGLQIVSIRSDSPAARGGLQQKDILVGLDRWSTLKMEDITWVLDHRQAEVVNPLRYHIVRSNEPFYGDMALIGQQH